MTNQNKNNTTVKKYKANNRISLRLSEHDNEYLHEKAQGHNTSRSQFIRHLIHNNEHNSNHEYSLNKLQMKQINNQLNKMESTLSKLYLNSYRIGGNLNQIAREMKGNVSDKLIKETKKDSKRYEEDEANITIITNKLIENCMNYIKFHTKYSKVIKKINAAKQKKRDGKNNDN